MNNDDQTIAILRQILDAQEQTLAVQEEMLAGQRKAQENQLATARIELATSQLYRVSLAVLVVLIGTALFWFCRP